MKRTYASSPRAQHARTLVEGLQSTFAAALTQVATNVGLEASFQPIEWLRDDGAHGGGARLSTGQTNMFHSASVNVSQVHYDDQADKRLSSATALSTIIHPLHPLAPSMHMHISWTEMRDGSGYWRVMADLNPSIPNATDTAAFNVAMQTAAPAQFDEGKAQGERYFFIPALDRHRGVAHFYLEGYKSDDDTADQAFAQSFGDVVIQAYCSIVENALSGATPPTDDEKRAQLEYHTVYLFQVLTLDRGTTSGLLVHDQNDVGTLGSIPPYVDRACLHNWRSTVPAPQELLVDKLVEILAAEGASETVFVTDAVRASLAKAVRTHYREHPDALKLQASGNVIPPTVANHRG